MLTRVSYGVIAVVLLGISVMEVSSTGITTKATLAGLGGLVLAISAAAGKG